MATSDRPATATLPGLAAADDLERAAGMEVAGRLLGIRARTTAEMVADLRARGFDDGVVDSVVVRLTDLRLLDDAGFARMWVAERAARKRLAPAALVAELEVKGVPRAIAEAALAEHAIDEEAAARALAVDLATRIGHLPVVRQAARISGALARRGYGPDAVRAALKAALPPDDWD